MCRGYTYAKARAFSLPPSLSLPLFPSLSHSPSPLHSPSLSFTPSLHPRPPSLTPSLSSQGRYCSRCLYGSGCRGCVISPSSSHNLRPGDYLAVTTERVGECEGVMYEEVLDHPSLASRRETNLTLEECLSVFSQRSVCVCVCVCVCV